MGIGYPRDTNDGKSRLISFYLVLTSKDHIWILSVFNDLCIQVYNRFVSSSSVDPYVLKPLCGLAANRTTTMPGCKFPSTGKVYVAWFCLTTLTELSTYLTPMIPARFLKLQPLCF